MVTNFDFFQESMHIQCQQPPQALRASSTTRDGDSLIAEAMVRCSPSRGAMVTFLRESLFPAKAATDYCLEIKKAKQPDEDCRLSFFARYCLCCSVHQIC